MRSGRSAVKENSVWSRIRAVCWGTAAGAVVLTLLILLLSLVFVKLRRVPQGAAVPLTIAAAAAASFIAGYVSGRISQQKGILYGFSSAMLLFVLLFLCGVILVREPIASSMFVKLGSMVLLGILGGILGVNRKNSVRIR